jgi:predicted acyltransferase
MRGLACLLMFQTHCYDSWLGGDARKSTFLTWSQLGGTLPAPLFLFLAGISFAFVTGKLVRKNMSAGAITRTMARRGAEIFAFGLLFRLQEFLIAWGWAPKSDLFRVDILNTIGLSMILMALVCGLALRTAGQHSQRTTLVAAAISSTTLIALLTPLLWTTWRPTWLPWPLETYINGCHNLGAPQPWLFPVFPWTAFAFAGLAAGFLLFSDWARAHTAQTLALSGVSGATLILIARWLDHLPRQLYAVYDYWHTSPNFLFTRVGILLVIVFLSYAWCRWGLGAWGFSPLIQLGQTSLLVYWVHIEFVYGRFSILPKRAVGIRTASLGLLTIFLMMLALSLLRTRIDWRAITASLRARMSQPLSP